MPDREKIIDDIINTRLQKKDSSIICNVILIVWWELHQDMKKMLMKFWITLEQRTSEKQIDLMKAACDVLAGNVHVGVEWNKYNESDNNPQTNEQLESPDTRSISKLLVQKIWWIPCTNGCKTKHFIKCNQNNTGLVDNG